MSRLSCGCFEHEDGVACLGEERKRYAALLAAAKSVLKMAEDIDHIEIVTVGAKSSLDALAAAVRDCESSDSERETDEYDYNLSRGD